MPQGSHIMHSSSIHSAKFSNSEAFLAPTSQHIDLWEHAILLYQAFEWPDAAGTFEYLSTIIQHPRQRFLCLLNTALIQARLRDFHLALDNVEDAVRTEPQHPIAFFLMGLVEWELRNPIKAESCFTTCLALLGGQDRACDYLRFNFMLKASATLDNIGACQVTSHPRAILAGFPAELLFEAPLRATGSSSGQTVLSLPLSTRTTLTSNSPNILAEKTSKISLGTEVAVRPAKWRPLITPETAEKIATELLRSMAAVKDPATEDGGSVKALRARRNKLRKIKQADLRKWAINFAQNMLRRADSQTDPKTAATPILTPKIRHVARDARVIVESTQDLVDFLQDGSSDLSPRHARVEDDTTHDLARFIKHQGYEDELSVDFNERSAKRWSDSTNEMLDNLIAEYESFPDMSNTGEGSARLVNANVQDDHASRCASIDRTSISSRSRYAHRPPTTYGMTVKEFLDAAMNMSDNEADISRAANPLTNLHTAYSSSSSVYELMTAAERSTRAHQGSLQNLEGRVKDSISSLRRTFTVRSRPIPPPKPSPPPLSLRESPPNSFISTVPTAEFFNHVLSE